MYPAGVATRDALEYQRSQTCAVALEQLSLPRGDLPDTTEWGGEAQVHTTADTLFLTHTGHGWRIAAAGCQPRGDALRLQGAGTMNDARLLCAVYSLLIGLGLAYIIVLGVLHR